DKIRQLGWEQTTDIIITQDHNHSTVSGDVAHFPFRGVADGRVGSHDPYGYSVSGFVRTAALLTLDGLKAYDGAGCRNIPTLSGILFDGTHLHPAKNDADGTFCGKAQIFTSPRYLVPKPGPARGRGPDIIVSFSFDENVAVAGRPGISYASSVNRRGDHGSFSRTDTHISLMAHGPDFKSGMYDTLPTANVDIAPTVARILG